ncbi:protein prenylyltransferase [Daldinia bambusicola]|nr:protein prenylyltransferase [Daldinia bambusicola]
MSRSLDSDLLAYLEADDHSKVYKDISAVLTNLPENELLEIEFLGKSHPLQPGVNYLRDGTAIAIPKLRLAQAFFVARQLLQAYHKDGRVNSRVNSSEVMAATAVLLLMDPEHLTAANTRKRLLISSLKTSRTSELALRREKQFMDSLLTSRLYRHAKSPTLWSHRRWLLHLFTVHDVVVDLHHDIKNVVMIAGIRHPRNYPAWHHARCLVDHDWELAYSIVADAKEFCLKNHTDISSWSFLVYAINKIKNKEDRRVVGSSVFEEVLGITTSLRWISESVWTFLRTIATVGLISDQQFEFFLAANKKLASITPESSDQWKMLDIARHWCEKYRPPTRSKMTE